jgi:nucleotidyltransferase substrate binding protein (TIGR01987 family)
MSGKLDSLFDQYKRAVERFKEVMLQPRTDIVRDSAIQRFEFSSELAWKLMKAHLEEKGAREIYFPKDIIRNAFQAGIIKDDPRWLDMVDARNKTSHIYSEAMAEKVYQQLPVYLPLFAELLKTLS